MILVGARAIVRHVFFYKSTRLHDIRRNISNTASPGSKCAKGSTECAIWTTPATSQYLSGKPHGPWPKWFATPLLGPSDRPASDMAHVTCHRVLGPCHMVLLNSCCRNRVCGSYSVGKNFGLPALPHVVVSTPCVPNASFSESVS